MDKAAYLQKKREQQESADHFKRESFCYKCFRIESNCLCDRIVPFETKAHFVILMHPMEAKKEKLGTGRICLSALKNSQMIMGIDFTLNEEVNALINDTDNYCMVMYPGENSLNISTDDVSRLTNFSSKRLVLFLIDGTWPCAKKMMKLSKNIHSLPRISFTATHQSLFHIKEQPAEYCLSTLESIHFFLNECERRGLESLDKKQDNMLEVFQYMVDFQIKCALDPSLSSYRGNKAGYSTGQERKKNKKWGTNRIIYKG